MEHLNIYKGNLATFPTAVLELENLKSLQLPCHDFTAIPDDIDRLKNLETLYFDGGACGATPISYIPERIGNLQKLKNFSIGYSKKRLQLPLSFTTLQNLEYFGCYGCGIQELPKDIDKLKKLQHLTLLNMEDFRPFPESIFRLPALNDFTFYQYGKEVDPLLLAQKKQFDAWGAGIERYSFAINQN